MSDRQRIQEILASHVAKTHQDSDYFAALRQLVQGRSQADEVSRIIWQEAIDTVYARLRDELLTNEAPPRSPVKFGTSGWRGLLGKDLNIRSVAAVTAAILDLYRRAEQEPEIAKALGVGGFSEMRQRGCVIGFDNRFGGPLLARAAANVLAENGVRILYAGEATTGILSASVLVRQAAFSINLTPSHNPLEYGGYKYNAADAGPAAPILTDAITGQARVILDQGRHPLLPEADLLIRELDELENLEQENALTSWQQLMAQGKTRHGIDYSRLLADLAEHEELLVAVDCVHGASRSYIAPLLGNPSREHLRLLRDTADPTFGGIAPEPSSENMQPVMRLLAASDRKLKIGAIIDPDGDRIRFTDGRDEISMNQFGAMAYYFLHEIKGKKGMVAKTVASSNLANSVAKGLGEEVFEPRVGFKEFKPVVDKALVCFEESDGITVIGHTPEKDAFIGLILALDMVISQEKNLGELLEELENRFGHTYPDRDGVAVSQQGDELQDTLRQLEKYGVGSRVQIGGQEKTIREVLTIDGRKMIFEDGSWIMIRPSGTEPKVRFYVEARTREETRHLVAAAKKMLAEIGLIP